MRSLVSFSLLSCVSIIDDLSAGGRICIFISQRCQRSETIKDRRPPQKKPKKKTKEAHRQRLKLLISR
ncbi:hypothetical protein Q8A67_005070 [Cirrhinus molitorella]|uniref:Uncharacterized protein n=1 Tax=Cirrhinus molitorella TaxID=172907 RepID=A0AA88Q7F1_9TELE|nr:hypothetical protein Q8A67_005070 [Cirrhinus molitorella]